jgi:hypothetical protein
VFQVTAYTKWDTISDNVKASQRPVVLNRASSINTKNFFGATLCYGYKNMIFEVGQNSVCGLRRALAGLYGALNRLNGVHGR